MTGAGASGLIRTLARLAVLALIAWASLRALEWVKVASDVMPDAVGPAVYFAVLALALVAYALLLALPFVPGIEIGVMILAMQGPGAALPVYLATLGGLGLAYGAGAGMPPRWIAGALGDLGLSRAAGFVERVAALPSVDRVAVLRERLPDRWAAVLVGWRYLLLAAVLNLPGNWLVGGGGGVMIVAGLSGVFRPAATLATVALAVAPVPLLVWGFGLRLGGA